MANLSPKQAHKLSSSGRKHSIGIFLLGFLSAIVLIRLFQNDNPSFSTKKKFRGPQYWKPGVTQDVTTLYETPFARFQLHKVQLEDSVVIDDWMWYDESDNINVLVETQRGTFLVFRQTKYAFQGESYAVVGGLIEPGESPLQAAQRELKEELGMQALEWTALGSYTAAANRGGGTTHPFLARHATGYKSAGTGIAEGEAERQTVLELSREELLEALTKGRFQEIKWTATVALALLQTGE